MLCNNTTHFQPRAQLKVSSCTRQVYKECCVIWKSIAVLIRNFKEKWQRIVRADTTQRRGKCSPHFSGGRCRANISLDLECFLSMSGCFFQWLLSRTQSTKVTYSGWIPFLQWISNTRKKENDRRILPPISQGIFGKLSHCLTSTMIYSSQ